MKGGVKMPQKDYSGFADGDEASLTIDQWRSLARSAENDCQRAIEWANKAEHDLKCLQESAVDQKAFDQMKARALQAEQEIERLKGAVGMEMMQERDAAVAQSKKMAELALDAAKKLTYFASYLDMYTDGQKARRSLGNLENEARAALQPSGEQTGTTMSDWHEAYGPGPCGCPYDANALVDRETGKVIQWECLVCGETIDVMESDDG